MLRLNYDDRGEFLGEFHSEDEILVVNKNGDFYTTNFDLSNHFIKEFERIEKFDSNKIWTAVLYDADQEFMYIKRFTFESSARKLNFLGENVNSKLFLLTDTAYPRIEVNFGGADSHRLALEIDAEEFIGMKSYKARGKRLTTFEIKNIKELEPTRFPEKKEESNEISLNQINDDEDEDNMIIHKQGKQTSLFDEDGNEKKDKDDKK